MSDAASELADWLHRIWEGLARAAAEPDTPLRYAALATAGLAGGAEARTVGLKDADPDAATVTVFTDTDSAKMAELRRDPRSTLLFRDQAAEEQFRLRVTVTIGTGAATRAIWAALPPPVRIHYGRDPAPGTPIAGPGAFRPLPDRENFAVLTCAVEEIDALCLRGTPAEHRRARFRRSEDWAGVWLVP